MIDRVLAVLSLIGVVAYFIPLLVNVPEPALFAVLCLVILMAAYDFFLELRKPPQQ